MVWKVVGQEADRVAAHDGELAGLAQAPLARRAAVVGALVEHVVLLAAHARDHRPGGVVVRRLRLARHPGGGVEREAGIGVLGEAVDLPVLAAGTGKSAAGKSSSREASWMISALIRSSAARVTPWSRSIRRTRWTVSATAAARALVVMAGPPFPKSPQGVGSIS
jgi:hypothetical protein